jgi:hypothetical protein
MGSYRDAREHEECFAVEGMESAEGENAFLNHRFQPEVKEEHRPSYRPKWGRALRWSFSENPTRTK